MKKLKQPFILFTYNVTMSMVTFMLLSINAFADEFDYIKKALDSSYKLNAILREVDANHSRKDAVKFYFLPTGEVKIIGKKTNASQTTPERTVKITSKIAGAGVVDAIENTNINIDIASLRANAEASNIRNGVLRNVAIIELYKDAIDKTKKLKGKASIISKQVRANLLSGLSSESDLEQIQLLTKKIDSEIIAYKKQLEGVNGDIVRLTGVPFDMGVISGRWIQNVSKIDINKLSVRDNFDYKISFLELSLANKKANMSPLDWEVKVAYENKKIKNREPDDIIDIQFKVDFFDFSRNKEIDANRYLHQSKKSDLLWLENDLRNQMNSISLSSDFNKEELRNINEQISSLTEISTSLKENFDLGRSSFYEILSNEKELLAAIGQKNQLEIKNISYIFDALHLAGKNFE
ncbi:MAG: TolC family protein [Turicibacter sp.]